MIEFHVPSIPVQGLIVIEDETVCFFALGDEFAARFNVEEGEDLAALDGNLQFSICKDEYPILFGD